MFPCVTGKWMTNFGENILTLHTWFPNWDYWEHSLKRSLKKKISKKRWKLVPIALVLKRRNLWKSKTVDKFTPETSNRTYCKIHTFLLTWGFQYSTNADFSNLKMYILCSDTASQITLISRECFFMPLWRTIKNSGQEGRLAKIIKKRKRNKNLKISGFCAVFNCSNRVDREKD